MVKISGNSITKRLNANNKLATRGLHTKALNVEAPTGYDLIAEIDTMRYRGNAGDEIAIFVKPGKMNVREMEVTLYDIEGVEIESGIAVQQVDDRFLYFVVETVAEMPVRVRVIAHDRDEKVMKEALV